MVENIAVSHRVLDTQPPFSCMRTRIIYPPKILLNANEYRDPRSHSSESLLQVSRKKEADVAKTFLEPAPTSPCRPTCSPISSIKRLELIASHILCFILQTVAKMEKLSQLANLSKRKEAFSEPDVMFGIDIGMCCMYHLSILLTPFLLTLKLFGGKSHESRLCYS